MKRILRLSILLAVMVLMLAPAVPAMAAQKDPDSAEAYVADVATYAAEAEEEPSEDFTDSESDPDSEQTITYKISLDKSSLSFSLSGKTAQLTATVSTADGVKAEDAKVTWASETPSVAAVSKTGLVTPKADGKAQITASVGDASASCTVTVSFYNGVYQDPDGSGNWYYYKNGKVDTAKTDGVECTAKGEKAWWSVEKGVVKAKYTGFAKDGSTWWYINEGKKETSRNDIIKDTSGKIGSKGDWWYVVGGKVQFNYTGVGDFKNSRGWWYVKKGKVDFHFTGISSNKNGFWYVRNGKVDFSYSGSYKVGDLKYSIKKGKVDTDVVYYNKTLSDSTLKMLTGKKGLLLSRTLTQDEFYRIVNEFMKDSYVRNTKYRMVATASVYQGGSRWDCSNMTLYFMNYYLLTYDQAYSAAKQANPSAQKSALTSKALSSVGKLASEASLTPANAVSQALSWGNPVYTYKTVGQLSADNPGNLRYGDLLFFGKNNGDSVRITHVAIYLGQYYLDSGDTGYYILENTDSALGVVKEGRADGVRIDPFDPTRTSSVLVHAARIF